MNKTARDFHQQAMDLYDFGKIFKAKGYPDYYYEGNLSMAYNLDKEAAIRIQSETTDILWKAVYPYSAALLAFKSAKYLEAKQLVLLGLSHRGKVNDYEIGRLEKLLVKINEKITLLNLEEVAINNSILAVVFSANLDEKSLQIRPIGRKGNQIIQVAADKITQIARLYLGETVEIELKENEKGQKILQNIRRAA